MKLSELLKGINPVSIVNGDTAMEITGVSIDSRKVEPGHLFVAIKGTATDGHNYIAKAIELGARAVLCENVPENATGAVVVQVMNTGDCVGQVATT